MKIVSQSAPPSVRSVPDRKVGFRQSPFASQADNAQQGLVRNQLRLSLAAGSQGVLDAGRVMRAVDSNYIRTVDATVSADLAVHIVLGGSEPRHVERINHGGALPDLARMKVNLYVGEAVHSAAITALAEHLCRAYASRSPRLPVVERANTAISTWVAARA